MYESFTALSSARQLALKRRCVGGVSVEDFDDIVESLSDTPWTHVLLAVDKLNISVQDDDKNPSKHPFNRFSQIFAGECPKCQAFI